MIISAFVSGNEFIEIERAANNKYFINYGTGYAKYTKQKYNSSVAGGFNKYMDAMQTLKKHRPHAKQIKTYCAGCKARKILSYDPDTKTTGYCDCYGCNYDSAYTGCIYHDLEPFKNYTVCFVDGHDMKYKTVVIDAENEKKAVSMVFDRFGYGFEHRLTGVYKND